MGENKKEVKARKKAFRKAKHRDPSMERIIDRMCDSGSDLRAAVQLIKRF